MRRKMDAGWVPGSRSPSLLHSTELALAPTPRLGRGQFPELPLSDDGDPVSEGGQAPDLHEFSSAILTRDLELVRPPAHQHIGRASGFRLYDCAGLPSCGE